jgi:hypothetical protein
MFLTDAAFSQGDTRAQILRFPHVECDTVSLDALVAAAGRLSHVEAVTSFADTCLMNACRLARQLGVRGLDPAVERLKDKGAVYSLVPEHSPPSVSFSSSAVPVGALDDLLQAHGALMVKGRCGSGGQGALVLRDRDGIRSLEEALRRTPIPPHLAPDRFIAQALIDGQLVSLEGYVDEGKPVFLGFSGRKKVGMSESRILFPWDDELPASVRESAGEAVSKLVARSELQRGYFHIEFMTTATAAYMIDANVGRIGGGGLGQQIAIAHGIAPEEVHAHALALSIGDRAAAPAAYRDGPRRQTISIMYGLPVEGQFARLELPPGLPGYHTAILDAPQRVSPMGSDNYAWIAIASGEDGPLQRWLDGVRIVTANGQFSPVY